MPYGARAEAPFFCRPALAAFERVNRELPREGYPCWARSMPKLSYFTSGRGLYAAIVVLVLIVIVALIGSAAVRRYDHYLSGLWIGDPAFLKKAQLRDLQLFIAPREEACRQGYLIITDENGEFISNQAIEIRERGGSRRWSALRSMFRAEKDAYTSRRFEIEYDSVLEGDEPPMPETMRMTLSILDGTLTLYDGEKVYAFMEKDLAASAAAIEAFNA